MANTEIQKKGAKEMVSNNHRIFRITADTIHQQIASLHEEYARLGKEAASFDKDGDANHDVVVYQNQSAQEQVSGQIQQLNTYLQVEGFVRPENLVGIETVSIGHEVTFQADYHDGEKPETLSVLLGSKIDSLILGKRKDLGIKVLSVESALGAAIVGKRTHEVFDAETEAGKVSLIINAFEISPLLNKASEYYP